MTFTKRADTAVLAACCLAFGLYWGSSYIGFSNALLQLQLTAFIEICTRGMSCILFAVVLYKLRKIPTVLFVAMFALQLCVIVAKTTSFLAHNMFFSLAMSISYGLYSGFLLICTAYCLYAFSSYKTLYCVIPLGFIVSYTYGTCAVTSDIQPIINALAGIAIPIILCISLRQKSMLSHTIVSTHAGLDKLIAQAKVWTQRSSERSPSLYFFGAIALLLILLGVWFRVGTSIEGALWLLKPRVSIWCITVLFAVLLIMIITRGRISVRMFSLGTLGAFLGILTLTAFFWDEATDFIQGFSGIWLVTFQSMLYISCRSFGKTNIDHAIGLAIFQGAALIMLALGNVIELLFFGDLLFNKFSFLAFSFVSLFIFAVATIAEFYPLLKKPESEKRTSTESSTDLNTGNKDRTETALAFLCTKFGVTAREQDILGRYARGRSIASIAEDLFLSQDTVKTHVKRAYAKLDIHSRRDLQDAIEAAESKLKNG